MLYFFVYAVSVGQCHYSAVFLESELQMRSLVGNKDRHSTFVNFSDHGTSLSPWIWHRNNQLWSSICQESEFIVNCWAGLDVLDLYLGASLIVLGLLEYVYKHICPTPRRKRYLIQKSKIPTVPLGLASYGIERVLRTKVILRFPQ